MALIADTQPRQHARRDKDLEPRCDAFTSWALASGFRDALPPGVATIGDRPVWLMLELRQTDSVSVGWLYHKAASLPARQLRLAGQYAQPLQGLASLRFCTALASPAFITYLRDGLAPDGLSGPVRQAWAAIRLAIERYEIGLVADAWPTQAVEPARLGHSLLQMPPAIIGVIDDGLPVAHERFSWQDTQGQRHTRFLALWDQSCRRACDPHWGLGRSLDMGTMNQAMAAAANQGRPDEEAVYQHLGLAHLLRHRITHGAHVCDLACGATPPAALAAAPAIVGVQLRPLESTLCISPAAHLYDAMRYVLAQADAASGGRRCPVIINASLGNIAGPKDGSSMFESAVDALIQMRSAASGPGSLEVVLPEGNSYLSRCHAWSELAAGKAFSIDWLLRPDDGTSSYLELWFRPKNYRTPSRKPRRLDITLIVTPPGGPPTPLRAAGPVGGGAAAREISFRDSQGAVIALLGLHPHPANGKFWMGLLTVAPTAAYGPWQRCAPAGSWRIEVRANAGSTAFYCNIYSQRDEKSFGYRSYGRQAILHDGQDIDYDGSGRTVMFDGDSFRRRAGTINGLANGEATRVVGGLLRQSNGKLVPAPYSAVRIPGITQRPTPLMALCEDSPVLHGLHAAGTRSGTAVTLSGTSMAAPQLARALAEKRLSGPARAIDFNGQWRSVVLPAQDLDRRSRRRTWR